MKWSENLVNYAEKFWRIRKNFLNEFGKAADEFLNGLTADETVLMKYYLATLPISDLGDYPLELLLHCAQNALAAHEEFTWCAKLPEHIFVLNVAYPRINTEEMAECRQIFHNALAARVRDLPLEKAILEVNRWCAEEATYRSTDLATASPLAVYNCGYGRCGEESTFAVTALRSVGIAARQVYAPWWSHCDDNHAWVEVFDGNSWRYLGACEPEPTLDRGWFTSAASRAMMIHARAFVAGDSSDVSFLFPEVNSENIHIEHGVLLESVTHNYAETHLLTVRVADENGCAISGAHVHFSVLNMAQFAEIAVRKTQSNGEAYIYLGSGSVRVSAVLDGLFGEMTVNTADADCITVVMRATGVEDAKNIDFYAPRGAVGYPEPLSDEQKAIRREWLEVAASHREKKAVPQCRNLSDNEREIWLTLSDKDRAQSPRETVLADSALAFDYKNQYLIEIFREFLLCPRIALEPLTPWRENVIGLLSSEQKSDFFAEPQKIWTWIENNIVFVDSNPEISGTPAGILRLKCANEMGRRVLFCAIARAIGVPARISPIDSTPEFYSDGSFISVDGLKADAVLMLVAPADQPALFSKNYTVARIENGAAVTLNMPDIDAGEVAKMTLPCGLYRVVTTTRLPNGNQLAYQYEFKLSRDETVTVSLLFRQPTLDEMFECQALPPFVLSDGVQQFVSIDLLSSAPNSLLIWLEVGREPTEHILNELRESAGAFAKVDCAICLILESSADLRDPTLQRTLSALKTSGKGNVSIYFADFIDTVPTLARRMFGDPDKLPLVILADCKANGLYSCSGYNVGTAELLTKLLSALK